MPQEYRRRQAASVVRRILAIALLSSLTGALRGEAPLTTTDVVRFLRAGIGERTILAELRDRGFGEPLDQSRESALREAGATETLVVAVRRAAPSAEKVNPSAPPGPTSDDPRGPSVNLHQPTFASDARTVRVPVSVLDKEGRPVIGLRGVDFRVVEDGKRQAVTLFSGERRPLRIAIALDISGSMDDKILQVQAALKHFIDLLEPEDQILVITFNAHVYVVQDFTSDRDLLGRVLDALEAGGGTALYDATFEAIRRVSRGPAESKAVVLVTDGVDTSSVTSFDALRELARRSEVPVFSIGLDSGDVRTPFRLMNHPGGIGGGPRGWPGGGVEEAVAGRAGEADRAGGLATAGRSERASTDSHFRTLRTRRVVGPRSSRESNTTLPRQSCPVRRASRLPSSRSP